MSSRARILTGILIVGLLAVTAAAQNAATADAQPTIVLGQFGSWRIFHTLRPPVVDEGRKTTAYVREPAWLNRETAEPAADWTSLEFDDGAWLRGPLDLAVRTPYLSRICLRGKFRVSDPAKVDSLSLAVAYHGGAVVYLNGQEVGRRDIAKDASGPPALANPYPLEAFVAENGDLLAVGSTYLPGQRRTGQPSADSVRRMESRKRSIDSLTIPTKLLRKGVNVLAVEIVRAPFHKVVLETTAEAGKVRDNRFDWGTCQVFDVELTAAAAEGIEPNAVRPQGLQVFNADPLAADTDMDFGDPCEALQPIRLVGVRNGAYSGKVVVGSAGPLANPRAVAGELKGPAGAAIPVSAVRVRYGLPWGEEQALTRSGGVFPYPYPRDANLLGMLSDQPPQEVAVSEKRAGNRYQEQIRPVPVSGAVLPVWVTVKVPQDAAPGQYAGQLTITVADAKPVTVPIELQVVDWTLPSPHQWRTWVELMESPDTLAMEYGVEPWSAKHWELIGRSMDLLAEAGSGVVYVPLLAETNLGNAESMVRWIDRGDGDDKVDFDFTIMDKYLDVAEQHMGKPKLVVFYIWEVYMIPEEGGPKRGGHGRMVRYMAGQKQQRGMGPLVTVVDPADGTTRTAELPTYFDPRSKPTWRRLMNDIRSRLKKRGLDDAMMIGMVTDAHPTREEVEFFADICPSVPWVSHGHGGFSPTQRLQETTPVGYQACVWYTKFADGVLTHGKTWPVQSMCGWRQDQLTVAFERNEGLASFPNTRWRQMGETNITGGQRGMGRIAGDFWPVVKDTRGRRRSIITRRYANSQWMNLNICNPVLAPGPDGAAATDRFEAMREGVQECEARIFIERALTDDAAKRRLGADLARRCQEHLDERMLIMWQSLSNHQLSGPMFFGATAWRWTPGITGHRWFIGSDYRERSRQLYALAGEVAGKLKNR